MTTNIRLNVPYFAQCDNEGWEEKSDAYMVPGNVQCAATSNSMLLNFMKPELMPEALRVFPEFESFYKARFDSLGYSADDRGDHGCHTETLKTFGVNTEWRTNLTDADITKSLSNKFPVVVGFQYKVSGHICLVVGRTNEGYLVHDPYGVRSGTSDSYSYINPGYGDTSGAFDLYRWDTLEVTLFDGDGQRSGAWGRVAV